MADDGSGYELHTGCKPIDDDHKEVVELLTQFVGEVNDSGVQDAPRRDALDALMSRVAERVVDHFAHEAAWMDRIGFADSEAHKDAHIVLVRDVEAHQLMLRKDGPSRSFKHWVNAGLVPWFRLHIRRFDVALSQAVTDFQRSGAGDGPTPGRPGLPA